MYLKPSVSKKGMKMFAVCNYQNTFSTSIASTLLDKQGWLSLSAIFKPADMDQLLRIAANSIAAQTGAAAPAIYPYTKACKVVATYASQETWFLNATIHPAYIEIYDYKCVRDAPTGPDPTLFTTAIYPGLAAEQLNPLATDTVDVLTPGVQPTDLSIFGHFYHITKRTKVLLAPGEHHIHKLNLSCNKLIDNEVISQISGNALSAYRGYTCGSFIRILGGLADTDTSANPVFNQYSVKAYTMTKYKIKPATYSGPHYEINPSGVSTAGNAQFLDTEIGEIFRQGTGFLGTTYQV